MGRRQADIRLIAWAVWWLCKIQAGDGLKASQAEFAQFAPGYEAMTAEEKAAEEKAAAEFEKKKAKGT